MGPSLYVINLDRDRLRLEEFVAANSACGLPIRRVPAVLGAELTNPPVDLEGYRRLNAGGGPPKAAEIGCYMSHVRALETFLADGEPHAVIMEDDAVLDPEAIQDLRLLTNRGDWDVVKLFCFHRGMPAKVVDLPGGHRLVIHLTRTTSTAAYLVNRRGAERLLSSLLPIKEPIDHAMDQGWLNGLRIRGVRPLMARLLPSAAASTIGYGAKKKQPWPQLLVVQLRKGLREVRRFSHGLGEYLSPKPPSP